MTPDLSPDFGYYLGCPQWTQSEWSSSIFPARCTPHDALLHYARAFNTVEGNTTFYAWPSEMTVAKWASQVGEGFNFLFKTPQEVTHQRGLQGSALEITCRFIEHLSPLGTRRGPLFIQLPASFTYQRLDTLYNFLRQLPRPSDYVVEVRDPELCYGAGLDDVNALLSEVQVERAWMDTRPLRAAPIPLNDATQKAWERKPNLPVYPIGLGPQPVIRYVAHPDVQANLMWLTQWAEVFARWITEGRRPFFFAHYPGETLAPQIAALFHEQLRRELDLPPRPLWPSEAQPSLF